MESGMTMRDGLRSSSEEELYIDSDDRERLQRMSERQRQEILYERHAKLAAHQEQKRVDEMLSRLEKAKSTMNTKEERNEVGGQEVTRESLSACMLTRDFLVENMHTPVLCRLAGHLVRVRVGDTYHVARIESVCECEEYTVRARGRDVRCSRVLDLFSGRRVPRRMGMQFVSNSPVENEELEAFVSENKGFDLWRQTRDAEALRKRAQDRRDVPESKKGSVSERRRRTLLKIGLIRKRERALEMDRHAQAESIQAQIDSLSDGEERERDVWAAISERNRRINADAARTKSVKPGDASEKEDSLDPCRRKHTRGNYS